MFALIHRDGVGVSRNRQLVALTSTERQLKARVLEMRLRDINPEMEITSEYWEWGRGFEF